MTDPTPIPLPGVLDPDRAHPLDDVVEADQRIDVIDKVYHEAVDYGRQLWDQLDALRGYLLDSAPTDGQPSARPTGPNDVAGWQAWERAYAAATSVLAGPHGDSGFGSQEADRESTARRTRTAH